MKLKAIGAAFVAAALLVITHGAAEAQVNIEGEPKVAFIYFNVKDDGGWVQAQEERASALKPIPESIPLIPKALKKSHQNSAPL